MTEMTFTFRLDPALKTAFAAIAEQQDLSAAQLLRRLMREAVEKHGEGAAHERWLRREIDDAMHEADAIRDVNLSNEVVDDEWERRKREIRGDDA